MGRAIQTVGGAGPAAVASSDHLVS